MSVEETEGTDKITGDFCGSIATLTEKQNMEGESPADQHNAGLRVPKIIDLGEVIADHLNEQSVEDDGQDQEGPSTAAPESCKQRSL